MSLALRPEGKWWYGEFPEGSKFVVKNLNVAVAGKRPTTLRETGDVAFERSRAAAQKAHDEILEATCDKRAGIKYAENLLELVSAEKHESPLASNLADIRATDKKLRKVEDGAKVRYEGNLRQGRQIPGADPCVGGNAGGRSVPGGGHWRTPRSRAAPCNQPPLPKQSAPRNQPVGGALPWACADRSCVCASTSRASPTRVWAPDWPAAEDLWDRPRRRATPVPRFAPSHPGPKARTHSSLGCQVSV